MTESHSGDPLVDDGRGFSERQSEEEMLRRQAQYTEGRKRSEAIRSCENMAGVMWGVRSTISQHERLRTVEQPNRFIGENLIDFIEDRQNVALVRIGEMEEGLIETFGLQSVLFGQIIDKDGKPKIGKEVQTKEELKNEVDRLSELREEVEARWRMLAASRFRRQQGMDLETITVRAFTSPWKIYPESEDFKWISRAGETIPGTERTTASEEYGVMIDKAMRILCDIGGQGFNELLNEDHKKRVEKIQEEGIRNIFGEARYASSQQEVLDFITERIVKPMVPVEKRKYSFRWADAQAAARLGLQIFRILDLDSYYDIRWEEKSGLDLQKWRNSFKAYLLKMPEPSYGESAFSKWAETWAREYNFEGGLNSGDLTKLFRFILRQVNEYSKNRQIIPPAIVGCIPNLTQDYLRATTVEFKWIDRKKDKRKTFTLWQLWRELGISFGDLPWGERKLTSEDERGRRLLDPLIDRRELSQGTEYEIKGISEDAYDIPKNLQQFYAVGTIFSDLTRKDVEKVLVESEDATQLRKLNKGYQVAFAAMTAGAGLSELERDKKTMTKLRQLAKVNRHIGFLVANIPDKKERQRAKKGKKFDSVVAQPDISQTTLLKVEHFRLHGHEIDLNTRIENILSASERSQYFSSLPGDEEQLEREKYLIAQAIGCTEFDALRELGFGGMPTRRGFLPHEAKDKNGNCWFDSIELKAIRKSGLYAPYSEHIK